VLDVSEPRGGFILRQGDLPVVLLSAGVFHWHNLPQEAPRLLRKLWSTSTVTDEAQLLPHPAPRPVRRAKIKNIHWHDKTPFFKGGRTWFAVVVRATSSS
jgi:hypothetical protein